MLTRRSAIAACTLPLALPGWAEAVAELTPNERALHALNRLGYGPRPGDLAAIESRGAKAWLDDFISAQLAPDTLARPPALEQRLAPMATLNESASALLGRYREVQKAQREAKREGEEKIANKRRELVRPVLAEASSARLARALGSPAQLEEVLVEFWFNHFNVFAGKGPVAVLVGAYERDAIRPHVLGRFRDMLGATAKHPAMLIYLDNVQSVAPGYQPPKRLAALNPIAARLTGLNENYARELMELHTLGVDGGYTQRDVTELAKMLTGWTVDYRAALRGGNQLFEFDARRHAKGEKQWLGRKVEARGQQEGEMALDVLAAHPATARHISFKLAQAFVADAPPPALVSRLAARFLETQGDLKAVTRTLIESPEFWSREAYGAKFKTPYQYLISSLRALDLNPPDVQPLLASLSGAGMPLYGAQTPDGYKNTQAAWMNPEALAQRVQFATQLAQRTRARPDALLATLGPLINDGTRKSIAGEPVNIQTALLLGSPDFMHR
ncbi:MAG TPA: DUF1800 domain-containing protein [Burkholderiaceae bacterium]